MKLLRNSGGLCAPANAEGLDGFNPLPNQDTTVCSNRDEFACLGLQPEEDDEDPRNQTVDRGDQNLGSRARTSYLRTSLAPRPKSSAQRHRLVAVSPRLHTASTQSGSRAARSRPPQSRQISADANGQAWVPGG